MRGGKKAAWEDPAGAWSPAPGLQGPFSGGAGSVGSPGQTWQASSGTGQGRAGTPGPQSGCTAWGRGIKAGSGILSAGWGTEGLHLDPGQDDGGSGGGRGLRSKSGAKSGRGCGGGGASAAGKPAGRALQHHLVPSRSPPPPGAPLRPARSYPLVLHGCSPGRPGPARGPCSLSQSQSCLCRGREPMARRALAAAAAAAPPVSAPSLAAARRRTLRDRLGNVVPG